MEAMRRYREIGTLKKERKKIKMLTSPMVTQED
jgi:hypothetical protein